MPMENIMVEFTSALWKKVRSKEINSEDAMITSELVKAVQQILSNIGEERVIPLNF